MNTLHTCGSLSKTKILKDAIGIECNVKKVLCSAEKSSVIWAEPHSKSSTEQFNRTEHSVYHQYLAACTKPKQSNQIGSLDFFWSVYSSSTTFYLVFICHSQKPIGIQVEIFYGLPNYPIIHSCKKVFLSNMAKAKGICKSHNQQEWSLRHICRTVSQVFCPDIKQFYTCLSLKRLCFRVKLMTCLRIKAYSARAPKTNNMQANNQISKAVTWLATGMRALYKE